tara:strand:+ start:1682 stop:2074 length:393 start_codon:yes stop_codon:yes gene_type:complete
MKLQTIKIIFFSSFAIFITFYQPKIEALSHEWIAVPSSQYGDQLWDKKSVKKNQKGFVRVLSKYIPKNKTNITQDIFYTMDINCSEKSFRDFAVGAKEFNEFENKDSKWKNPNEDKLISGVIEQVCAYIN